MAGSADPLETDALEALEALAARQRAHRSFRSDPVDRALVERILSVATRAPSAENRQPWHFVVVSSAGLRADIGDLMAAAWTGFAGDWSRDRIPAGMHADVEAGATGGLAGGIAGAPVLVVVCGDTETVAPGSLSSSVWPAVQNLLLAATAAGLGSALTTLATVDPDPLRRLLDLEEHLVPMAVVPLGRPGADLGPNRRHPAAERTTWR